MVQVAKIIKSTQCSFHHSKKNLNFWLKKWKGYNLEVPRIIKSKEATNMKLNPLSILLLLHTCTTILLLSSCCSLYFNKCAFCHNSQRLFLSWKRTVDTAKFVLCIFRSLWMCVPDSRIYYQMELRELASIPQL